MAPRRNPLNLNSLQLKTLTLLQELVRVSGTPEGDEARETVIRTLPDPHGDHFHLGDAIVAARDATGLRNAGVWAALQRKGLVRPHPPDGVVLTASGWEYDTGLRDVILHRSED
ncbi:MAG: hypothetical protein JO267_12100 [Alphaproteobacteria bacterium]|nr:hypothetical protein [Alphaproteobacteria bacterium]